MAWITKNAGTMQIDRREEPYLSDETRAKLEAEVIPRYATRQAATLPVLHEIQHLHNWIPYQALEEAAEFLGLSAGEVIDCATFYEEFFLHPKGRHLVQMCQSLSCELCGHEPILEKIQQKLDIMPGETTDDDRVTLMTVECLGSCGTAPALMIDGTLHENVTWEQAKRLLDDLA